MTEPRVRKVVEADVCNVLPLMRGLAEFEKYANNFAVTEELLREQGFRRSPPDFHCLIAESGDELVGFLVYYFVPFTYRAKPNLIIKELYVADGCRSKGVGKLLMRAIAKEAGLARIPYICRSVSGFSRILVSPVIPHSATAAGMVPARRVRLEG